VRFLKRLATFTEPDRWICVARELTKTFEEVQRGHISDLIEDWENRPSVKGEFVIVVSGKTYSE
jgi:16S rRNA (cytidine1402-2'-O)-methyltransferase